MIPIPYGKQYITEEDIQLVVDVLKSDYLTQGPKIIEFERAMASYLGCKFAVAVSNGTAALHLSALALGVKKGQKIITTPITFAASANCIRYCDGEVVFADIDPETYLLDLESVRKILEASPKGTYQGIIPVDFSGRAVDLEAFRALADEFNCWIIEDACHSPGGYFIDSKGIQQNCGNGNLAELSIFSFHPVKHIACGEGGMITTNDEILYQKLLQLRTHGIVKNEALFTNSIQLAGGESAYPNWYMEMQELGYNYRLTDFQAALGLGQLSRAEKGLEIRRNIAQKYTQAFENISGIKRKSGTVMGHAYHLYVIEVEERLHLYNYLKANNIFAQIHYFPTHLMPYYQNLGWKEGDLPHAENYYKNCISLPMFPSLTDEQFDYVVEIVLQGLKESKR
ncbi:UDP-4-amino-4,6-dideoxy-N-acetyl-beta-L-altrosamine transaminase [Aquirufa nivalisilvae]|uniref:UDP-4-amino-4, 6-dideoxy-N-acetyl-beta-L-altrosamine transaminase n=1 Tax=Aquirufa nivalisilvae TaxID=2516557 RepID=UPI0022A99FB4|nr:UDP-4-amino-4,6-dideoxy-N-acetyl-beta-L-altrosamine transaminase [Aquirufa nivalisilvae]MCZ2479742.1 UDP-4-amino-4,6-dideoxy-N-acetyl-beta-L-altrosamine transaminase [Aquirufa nivalisilvae]